MGTINDVRNLAETLLAKEFTFRTYYGEHTISAKELGYVFKFDNKKRSFGTCYYVKKEIHLSLPLCSENLDKIHTNIQNTILHELAHAFCVYVYGIISGRGHDQKWRSIAMQIGCNGKRCFNSDEVNAPKSKYTLLCDNCGTETRKHKLTNRLNKFACGKCCNEHNNGRFTEKYKLRLVQNY